MSGASFGFGPQFATRVEFIEVGVRKVTAGLVLPPGVADELLAAFIPAHRTGDPREELAVVRRLLAGRDWSWTWMLTSAMELQRIGVWPWYWSKSGFNAGDDWQAVSETTRLDFLRLALAFASYHARDETTVREAMRKRGFPMKFMVGRRECQAEAYFRARYTKAIEEGDMSVVPPYFPLDQTKIWPDLDRPPQPHPSGA